MTRDTTTQLANGDTLAERLNRIDPRTDETVTTDEMRDRLDLVGGGGCER